MSESSGIKMEMQAVAKEKCLVLADEKDSRRFAHKALVILKQMPSAAGVIFLYAQKNGDPWLVKKFKAILHDLSRAGSRRRATVVHKACRELLRKPCQNGDGRYNDKTVRRPAVRI